MKKLLALVLVLALSLTFFACNNGNKDDENGKGNDDELTVVKVGASPTPHADILAQVVDDMKERGYDLQIVEYTDYIQPNVAVSDGSLDANFFQHINYLNDYNAKNGTDLVAVAAIHYEPFGIYPGKDKDVTIETLPDGAIVSVPNDPSNEARALLLLEAVGLITLQEGVGLEATVLDIVDNPKNLQIKEVEAAQLIPSLPDVDIAIINGNYALQGGLSVADDAIAFEDKDATALEEYANYLVVNAGKENDPAILALVECLQSEKVRAYIESTYADGSVVPKF